ncbi:MAG: multiprotein bridging factor aMBF1 [Acidianus sp.]|nr:multiprotein bridging factor aMBF1 [Acidianus sp.]
MTLYCEVCGRPIKGAGHRVLLEGAEVLVCDDCFAKLTKSGRAVPVPRKPQKVTSAPKVRKQRAEMLEVVDDYPDLIRRAREERGWTTAVLAQKLRVSEDLVRRIEGGKVKPTVDLAKRIEELLKIKLLQPVEYEEEEAEGTKGGPDVLTFGDVAVVRRDEG